MFSATKKPRDLFENTFVLWVNMPTSGRTEFISVITTGFVLEKVILYRTHMIIPKGIQIHTKNTSKPPGDADSINGCVGKRLLTQGFQERTFPTKSRVGIPEEGEVKRRSLDG